MLVWLIKSPDRLFSQICWLVEFLRVNLLVCWLPVCSVLGCWLPVCTFCLLVDCLCANFVGLFTQCLCVNCFKYWVVDCLGAKFLSCWLPVCKVFGMFTAFTLICWLVTACVIFWGCWLPVCKLFGLLTDCGYFFSVVDCLCINLFIWDFDCLCANFVGLFIACVNLLGCWLPVCKFCLVVGCLCKFCWLVH